MWRTPFSPGSLPLATLNGFFLPSFPPGAAHYAAGPSGATREKRKILKGRKRRLAEEEDRTRYIRRQHSPLPAHFISGGAFLLCVLGEREKGTDIWHHPREWCSTSWLPCTRWNWPRSPQPPLSVDRRPVRSSHLLVRCTRKRRKRKEE